MARAPGTHKNHETATRTYIAFMRWAGLDHTAPTSSTACIYIEYLAMHLAAPGTIKNYVSHTRIYLVLAEGVSRPLSDPRVSRALDGLDRNKDYVPKEKAPVPMQVLRAVLSKLTATPEDRAVKAAYLLMFYAALRQSEVAPPSVSLFKSTYHLTRGDASFVGSNLTVMIKAGKNLQKCGQYKKVTMATSPDKDHCVVQAFRQLVMDTPTENNNDPCFMFPDTRAPMPVSYLNKRWDQIFTIIGLKAREYTLHGLRVAAASEAFQSGVPELEIQRYGGWRSQAHRTYIKASALDGVNKSLIKSLADNSK